MKAMRIGVVASLLASVLVIAPSVSAITDCTFTVSDMTMTLDGDCTTDETIVIPDGFTLDGDGHTITVPTGTDFKGAVVMNGGGEAHVTNLTIVAQDLANVCDSAGPPDNRLRAILFDGASGSITYTMVDGINQGASGCQEGNGIEVRNAPFDGTHPDTQHVTISHNVILDYQKNGITANGDVNARITDNMVTGLGPVPFIAQNGIQIGFGGTGTIMQNDVMGSWFTGADWTATGVLIFEADDVMVQRNDVSGSQTGIGIEAWCFGAPTANGNRVVQNSVDGADWAVTVAAYVLGFGLSSCDPSADNNKVVNNDLVNGGEIGVFLGTGFFFGGETTGFSPSADNNKAIRNQIQGYTDAVVVASASATKVHANVSTP